MNTAQIADTLDIQQLLTRYARAVDTKDWSLYRTVFTGDAHIDYRSAPFGINGTVEEIVNWLDQYLTLMPMTMHYITNIDTEISGDTAEVRAQFYNPMQFPGTDELSYCGGYYHHRMVRTPSGWRSQRLREENIWFAKPPSPSAKS